MMAAPKLLIRKRMQSIQGRVRPCGHVQALVDPALQALLEEHFLAEALFRRSAYSASWPAGAIAIPAALAPAMGSFLKNDACPEITVKTMLSGQHYQGATIWELMCFELVAKLSFDNMLALIESVSQFSHDVIYSGPMSLVVDDVCAFERDAELDQPILSAAELAA